VGYQLASWQRRPCVTSPCCRPSRRSRTFPTDDRMCRSKGCPRFRTPAAGHENHSLQPAAMWSSAILGARWVLVVRHEAPCCIPGSAGRNSEGGSWVRWLTWIRKVKGTIACQESSGRVQAYETRRCGTRVIWRIAGLPDSRISRRCKNTSAGKTHETGATSCVDFVRGSTQPPGRGAMPSEGIQGDELAA
jgi:hypothetical protein